MEIGFVGLGTMGFHMARRLIEAGHIVVVYDSRPEAIARLTALGATAAISPKDVADRVETVMASLPSLDAVWAVATGANGVIEGRKVRRFVDLSTSGARMAQKIAAARMGPSWSTRVSTWQWPRSAGASCSIPSRRA